MGKKGLRPTPFWSHVDVRTPDECWLWLAGKNSHGYGIYRCDRKSNYAHRWAYQLSNGYISSTLFVMHSCDTPLCCNPKHLSLGTPKQNSQDRNNKNRQAKGETGGNSKLKDTDVVQIRTLWEQGLHNFAEIGRRFNVSDTTVRYIVKRRNWKHI